MGGGQGAMAECDQQITYAYMKCPYVTQYHVQGVYTMRILGNISKRNI